MHSDEGAGGEPGRGVDDGPGTGDHYADDLAALHRVSTLPPGDPEERLAQWLDAGLELVDARQGVVLLGTPPELVVRAVAGGVAGGAVVDDEIADHRVTAALARRATIAVLGGAGGYGEADADLGAGTVVASPLWVSGEVAGALAYVAAPDRPPFANWSLALVDLVADGVARVLEHQADVGALVSVESRAAAMIDLIPDPVVRLDRDGRVVADPAGASGRAFDPCAAVRGPGERPDPTVHDRVVSVIGRSLETGIVQTAAFDSGPGAQARRVEARFVPASAHEVLCIVRDITDRHRAEQALAEQVAFEALVTSISTRLIGCSADALDDAIVAGLGEVASFFGADTAFIDELAVDGSSLHLSHVWTGPRADAARRRGDRVDLAGFRWLSARFERSGHVFARGPRNLPDEATATSLADPDDRGVLWVRLGSGGDLAGVVGLTWRSQDPPANDEVLGLVRFAADAFHGAIRRRSIALLAEGQAAVFESIARNEPVATALLGARDLLARHTLGATVVVLTVADGRLDLVADDPDDPWTAWFGALPLDLANPFGQATVTGEPVHVFDARSDPRFGTSAVPDASLRSVTVLPVRSPRHGRTLAVIALFGAEPGMVLARTAVRDSALSLLTVALERDHDLRALAHQATHDPLTGVGNRAALLDRLGLSLARARRSGRRVAVLFCDLDGFKAVNDRYGHDRGDRLLVEVAQRIRSAVRPSDTVSRTGGDEFVVVCEDLDTADQAQVIAERVRQAVEERPTVLGQARLHASISVGVALADTEHDDPDRLLRAADLAMYEAKERGREAGATRAGGSASSPSPSPSSSAVDEAPLGLGADAVDDLRPDAPGELRDHLAKAIANGDLELHQQPLVGRDGSLAGVEALLRWDAPHGRHGPEQVVAAAATLGLSSGLGRWVRRRALALRAEWPGAATRPVRPPVHVNVAGAELAAMGFIDHLADDLAAAGVAPEHLVLEVREADLHRAEVRGVLADLHHLGSPVLIDGAGEGGYPLLDLAHLPVHGIKLAPALVRGLDAAVESDGGAGVEVVRSLVLLAHGLGWRSLAVGVESDHQRSVLFGFGVDAVQGRAVTMPVSAEAFSTWLGSRRSA